MKVRNGFVSNSSSSSFAIYGTVLESDEFQYIMADLGISVDAYDTNSTYAALSEITEGTELTYVVSDSNDVAIGRPLSTICDDETGKQFKEETKAALQKVLGREVPCDFHVDSWYC